jgi:hypothetical protein
MGPVAGLRALAMGINFPSIFPRDDFFQKYWLFALKMGIFSYMIPFELPVSMKPW